MESKIVGTVMPVLELNMQPNDKVFAESGQLSWMSMAIQMQTSTSAGGQHESPGPSAVYKMLSKSLGACVTPADIGSWDKLYKDNAATLTPDPLHSAFYDSHPPAAVRIAPLQTMST